jgi:phosphoglycerol transferase
LIGSQPAEFAGIIRKTEHPEIFADGAVMTRGLGQTAIVPLSDMRGRLSCTIEAGSENNGTTDTLLLTLENQSRFHWKLGHGPFPIRIGVHLRQPDGSLLRWDDGYRVPTNAFIKRGTSRTLRLPLNTLPLKAEHQDNTALVAEFSLVQDDHAWFGDISCTVPLP